MARVGERMTVNQAEAYGVGLATVKTPFAWHVEEIRHLSPSENRGGHAIYVDAVDDHGNRVRDDDLRMAFRRSPQSAEELRKLDKNDGPMEKGDGVIELYINDAVSLYMVGSGLASDVVTNVHTRHADERGPNGENWNSVGHHSFYIKFKRYMLPITPPTDPDLIIPPTNELAQEVEDLRSRVQKLERWAMAFEGEL